MALPKGGTIGWRLDLLPLLPKASVGAEIGVLKGRFSRRILEHVKPRILYLVDVWERIPGSHYAAHDIRRAIRIVLHDFREDIKAGVVRPLMGRSIPMAELIADVSLDWVYIDGDHTYEGALGDLKAWSPKVKRGGYVMGHDYIGCEDHSDRGGTNVRRAVAEFGKTHDLEPIGVTDQRPATFWLEKTWE